MSATSDRSATATTFYVDDDLFGCDVPDGGTEATCGEITLRVRFHGRTVFDESPAAPADMFETWEEMDYRWYGCRDAGVHSWSAVYDGGDGRVARDGGRFRVPRCRYPRYRTVPYGTAAKAAQDLAPENEFVSDIYCRADGVRRGKRAGLWVCGVRSNNVWRYCDRAYRLDFMYAAEDDERGNGGWGRMERTYFWRQYARECHRF